MSKAVQFKPGKNIAMKVPAHEFDAVVSFYRDVLGFAELPEEAAQGMTVFDFDGKNLWIDRMGCMSQAEIWLEIVTDDIEAAARHFDQHKIKRRDEIESLPADLNGFWISSPANIIHLVDL